MASTSHRVRSLSVNAVGMLALGIALLAPFWEESIFFDVVVPAVAVFAILVIFFLTKTSTRGIHAVVFGELVAMLAVIILSVTYVALMWVGIADIAIALVLAVIGLVVDHREARSRGRGAKRAGEA